MICRPAPHFMIICCTSFHTVCTDVSYEYFVFSLLGGSFHSKWTPTADNLYIKRKSQPDDVQVLIFTSTGNRLPLAYCCSSLWSSLWEDSEITASNLFSCFQYWVLSLMAPPVKQAWLLLQSVLWVFHDSVLDMNYKFNTLFSILLKLFIFSMLKNWG